MIRNCCAAFPTYNKDSKQQGVILEVFNEVLHGYDNAQIYNAFTAWIKTSTSFPVPANIVDLIDNQTLERTPEQEEINAVGIIKWRISTSEIFVPDCDREKLERYEKLNSEVTWDNYKHYKAILKAARE